MKIAALMLTVTTFAAAPAFAQGYAQDDPGSYEVVDQPTSPAPGATPPPPPPQALQQPPVQGQTPYVAAPAAQVTPAGQWVFTAQYGWIWMPHAQSYTYVPAQGTPYMFVFYPSHGWRWVVAPWVYGWGPRPYWGTWGIGRFAWHSRPWFRPLPYHYYRAPANHYGAAPYRYGVHREHDRSARPGPKGGYHYAPRGNARGHEEHGRHR